MRSILENFFPSEEPRLLAFEWEVESSLIESEWEWFHYDIRDAIREDVRTKNISKTKEK